MEQLERDGKLTIHTVIRGSQAFQLARVLKREGLDAGEAEAIAWLVGRPPAGRPLFISNDRRAREGARMRSVPAGDLMDIVVELTAAGLLTDEEAAERLSVWSDKTQSLCRPRDFTTFEALLASRRNRGSLR